jgi:endonuclease-3
MSKKIEHIDEIINLLKIELDRYKMPIISHPTWDEFVRTPFTTLISCLLSLRTKDEVTEKASIRLFNEYNTPEKLANSSVQEIQKLIYPVGFYKIKAKRIIEISKTLIEKYNSKVPNDFNELLKLKGVGKKTAAIVMVYGHKNPEFIPVDVHVHVIANRLGWIKSKNPDETMDQLMKILPKRYWYDFNYLFVKFGQNICITVSPWCSRCPIEKFCPKVGVVRKR